MSDDSTVADSPAVDAARGAALPPGLLCRGDGVFFDPAVAAPALLAGVASVFQSNAYFVGLDYAVFIKALYNHGQPLARAVNGEALIRFADALAPFAPARRALYKLVKVQRGVAEYYFETQFLEALELPDGSKVPARPTKLDFDEFVADMWGKGVRFGIDAAAVRAIIASGKVERITVARQLEPAPGRDASIVEVSPEMHRDDAPREMADGRLDLLTFKNRFPQVKKHARLLKKVPSAPGLPGYELSGAALQPPPPEEVELAPLAGAGTVIERLRGDEFLVATQDGFVNVDADSGAISIGAKIVSHDGVSSRTTGNLKLRAEYEEFGEVQEQRTVDGSDITVHGDVFGHLHSHGGSITMLGNLIGGSALNAHGDIVVKCTWSGPRAASFPAPGSWSARPATAKSSPTRWSSASPRAARSPGAACRSTAPGRASRPRCWCTRWCRTWPGWTARSPNSRCAPRASRAPSSRSSTRSTRPASRSTCAIT